METNEILGQDVLGHSFLVVYLADKSYIVDLTYMQFFNKEKCQQSEYQEHDGVTISAPLPGYYYLINKKDIDIALSILEKGYVELTKRSAKVYLDSFYLTRRGRRYDIDINEDTYFNVFENAKRKRCK